jgi:hypothetical protein
MTLEVQCLICESELPVRDKTISNPYAEDRVFRQWEPSDFSMIWVERTVKNFAKVVNNHRTTGAWAQQIQTPEILPPK